MPALTFLFEKRTRSIIHEFSIRLLNLAGESEKHYNTIETVPGPWPIAIKTLSAKTAGKKVVVYLDAPYKREEYSRYYHVLETLISYNYPSAIGKGKIPDKSKGERFRSEFFTRSENHLTNSLEEVLVSCLKNNWICAWSYSDSGDASIVTVLNQINEKVSITTTSFATPYQHKAQGTHSAKEVIEYLVLMVPNG